uniref:Uncharacterized protein n=1 Tax=Sus scrofa TaxID=9823 RepID=A0A8W4FJH2_PIG
MSSYSRYLRKKHGSNRIPLHLKGGVAGALLYSATMILRVGCRLYQLAVASFPRKQV